MTWVKPGDNARIRKVTCLKQFELQRARPNSDFFFHLSAEKCLKQDTLPVLELSPGLTRVVKQVRPLTETSSI
jgi:hypothetical protein